MSWAPVTMRWPEHSTQWMGALGAAKDLANGEMGSTALRLAALDGLATTSPGPVGAAAQSAVAAGRAALSGALGEAPACLVVTPFQSGVGQGSGNQRYLSAPNLLRHLSTKLKDTQDAARPTGEQYALVILFLGMRYDQFAATLSRFNALLPIPDLQRAERRAQRLFDLETEKWVLPSAGMRPGWGQMPLQRCTVTKAAGRALAGQLSALEGYTADSSPMAELAALAQRKATQAQSRDQKLAELQALLSDNPADATILCRQIGPGNLNELSAQMLEGQAPGHEWGVSAGVVLVGSLKGLSFVRELVGL